MSHFQECEAVNSVNATEGCHPYCCASDFCNDKCQNGSEKITLPTTQTPHTTTTTSTTKTTTTQSTTTEAPNVPLTTALLVPTLQSTHYTSTMGSHTAQHTTVGNTDRPSCKLVYTYHSNMTS